MSLRTPTSSGICRGSQAHPNLRNLRNCQLDGIDAARRNESCVTHIFLKKFVFFSFVKRFVSIRGKKTWQKKHPPSSNSGNPHFLFHFRKTCRRVCPLFSLKRGMNLSVNAFVRVCNFAVSLSERFLFLDFCLHSLKHGKGP